MQKPCIGDCMLYIRTEPTLFTEEQTRQICTEYMAEHVMDTEYEGIPCAVFYGRVRHPKSGSRYFAVNLTKDQDKWKDTLHVSDGAFIEEQKFDAIIADNGDVIYSRHKNDNRTSDDGSVFITGGRSRTKTSKVEKSRLSTLTVFKGRVEYWESDSKHILT